MPQFQQGLQLVLATPLETGQDVGITVAIVRVRADEVDGIGVILVAIPRRVLILHWAALLRQLIYHRVVAVTSKKYFDYCLVGVPTYQITPPKLGAKVDHFAPIILFMLQSFLREHKKNGA